MTDVATTDPSRAIAGDTWEWKKSYADYPAPTWTLTYYLRSREHEATFNAAADGSEHLVTVAKATTAAYKAGRYELTAIVTDGTERFTVERKQLLVLPDPASTGKGLDPRGHARKVLESIEAVLEGRATRDQEEYTIGSRRLKGTPIEELLMLGDKYRGEG